MSPSTSSRRLPADTFFNLALGYVNAAEIVLLAHTKQMTGLRNDTLLYPVALSLRQGMELCLRGVLFRLKARAAALKSATVPLQTRSPHALAPLMDQIRAEAVKAGAKGILDDALLQRWGSLAERLDQLADETDMFHRPAPLGGIPLTAELAHVLHGDAMQAVYETRAVFSQLGVNTLLNGMHDSLS